LQIGIDSFAAAYTESSLRVSAADRLRDLVEQIEHADQASLDVFGIGEHHRREYLDSAPAVILAAAAARTRRIRLTSAVVVLSATDPVRLFQSFATLDLLSNGRAEMVVGRGSSIEAFPLFGFRPLVDLYREAGGRAGHAPDQLKVGVHALGYVAETTQEAADDYFPGYTRAVASVAKERGWPPSLGPVSMLSSAPKERC
jgi:alkanesulfonate monooxygenase SsuD/methylene tetrahydromethanopterin reductase-like flavin-dependent oxidoreductase (luciferase family)